MSTNPFYNPSPTGSREHAAAAGNPGAWSSGSRPPTGSAASPGPLLPTPGSTGTAGASGSGLHGSTTVSSASGSALGVPPGFYGAAHLHHHHGFSPLAQPYRPPSGASSSFSGYAEMSIMPRVRQNTAPFIPWSQRAHCGHRDRASHTEGQRHWAKWYLVTATTALPKFAFRCTAYHND